MSEGESILRKIVESDRAFCQAFLEYLKKNGISIKDFSRMANLPTSTLYKITSGRVKTIRSNTLRKIIKTIRELEEKEIRKDAIAIITTRTAIELTEKEISIDGKKYVILEYPADSIEEEIIQGIRAEKAGAKGIICGPIAATTLEKVVSIPIATIRFEEGPLRNAIDRLLKRIT